MRVAITTSVENFVRVATEVSRVGLVPVGLPCIEVRNEPEETLREVRSLAPEVDLILLTSARSVRLLWPSGGLPQVPSAAVGRATAAAVEDAGGVIELVGDGGAASLVASVAERLNGIQVLFPHAGGADPATIAALEAAGAYVTARQIYVVTPIAPDRQDVAAALFGSPSAVAGWHLARTLDGIAVAAVGPSTAAAVEHTTGRKPDVVAHPPSWARAAESLAALQTERSMP